MPIYLQRLTETAIRPTRATEGAAGLDLYADETVTIPEYRRAAAIVYVQSITVRPTRIPS